jgi:hypothetical protein
MHMANPDTIVVGGKVFSKEAKWVRAKKISKRTSSRHRARPNGLPFLEWGGCVWIPDDEGDAYIYSLVKRRNRNRGRPRKAERNDAA